MSDIILDCDLMKYPNSGLYHYCLNIGEEVNRLLEEEGGPSVKMYLPPKSNIPLDGTRRYIVEKKWHSVWKPFMHKCKIWHAPFQSGRIVPDRHRDKNVRVVLTIHDLNALHEGKPEEEQARSLQHTQGLIDRSDAIVCISEFTKADVMKNCKVDDKPLYVIHNGTHKLEQPQLNADSYKPLRPFLFGMGYVNRKKNYHVLLPLLVQNPDIEIIVAGRLDEPDYVAEIKVSAEALKVADRLHLPGPVTEGEKSWYLANCMAFVHPSLAEGFGAPVVEAMKFGKPLFLSDRTSLPEIGGDVCFYFRCFDREHMYTVFKEGMQTYNTNGLSEQIRKRGNHFDWKRSAAQYVSVYKSLMG